MEILESREVWMSRTFGVIANIEAKREYTTKISQRKRAALSNSFELEKCADKVLQLSNCRYSMTRFWREALFST